MRKSGFTYFLPNYCEEEEKKSRRGFLLFFFTTKTVCHIIYNRDLNRLFFLVQALTVSPRRAKERENAFLSFRHVAEQQSNESLWTFTVKTRSYFLSFRFVQVRNITLTRSGADWKEERENNIYGKNIESTNFLKVSPMVLGAKSHGPNPVVLATCK